MTAAATDRAVIRQSPQAGAWIVESTDRSRLYASGLTREHAGTMAKLINERNAIRDAALVLERVVAAQFNETELQVLDAARHQLLGAVRGCA